MASYSGPVDFDTRNHSPGGKSLFGMVGSLFAYADTTAEAQDLNIDTAHAAVTAMATRAPQLQDWVNSVDAEARSIKLGLGVFSDSENAIALAQRFALLGAVDENPVTVNGRPATQLVLSKLKPGVSRTDALDLARELGLNDIVLY
jgi:rare lipoprotein A